jgi:peptide/nickel transport system substrate-binding protein
LRFAIHTSGIGSFDPDFAKGSQDRTFADMVFNSLVRYVPGDSSRLEPDIAREIPEFVIRGGRQIWTIKLRTGVLFHKGPYTDAHELTAEDVAYSLEKAADPLRSSFFGDYAGMSFKLVDTHTLKIIVEKPISPLFFLPRIANREGGFIFSKKAIEAAGYENHKQHPVGTGPFMFEQYTAGGKLVLTANENYFRGKPLLDKVEVYFIPDNKKREAAYKSGHMDVIYGVGDPGWIDQMENEPDTIVNVFGPGFTGLFHFNTSIKPLDDIRVRQAITHALDRELFLAASSNKLVTQVYASMSPEFLSGGLANEKIKKLGLVINKDLKRARQLLASAGYANGFSLDLVTSEKRIYRRTYEILKEQLDKIGIHINLTLVPHSKMHKLIRQDLNAIVLYFAFRPNADSYLRGFFHSDSIVGTGKKPLTNFSHYTKVDRLIDDALNTIDPKMQINLWEQTQIRILHDAMAYPLFNVNECIVRRGYVNFGHPLISTLAGYPQFNEKTHK